MKQRNHYSTLHIDRCASCAEIKSAFRILAQRFHPDVTTDQDGERKFKDVAEAYRTLRRPDSKLAYDHQIDNLALSAGFPAFGTFEWGLLLLQCYSCFWLDRGRDGE